MTTRPLVAMWLSAAIAIGSVWIGLTASYAIPKMPPSFAILAVATATYLGAIAASHIRSRMPAGDVAEPALALALESVMK